VRLAGRTKKKGRGSKTSPFEFNQIPNKTSIYASANSAPTLSKKSGLKVPIEKAVYRYVASDDWLPWCSSPVKLWRNDIVKRMVRLQ